MISRVRIDTFGKDAQDCVDSLYRTAVDVQRAIGINCAFGEEVIEHQLEEPHGSDFYYKGRLSLHFELLTTTGPPTHGTADSSPPIPAGV